MLDSSSSVFCRGPLARAPASLIYISISQTEMSIVNLRIFVKYAGLIRVMAQ